MRQIVLDTETTGLDPAEGHRVIEIGCVEICNRQLTGKQFQCYLNPSREVDEAAIEVHGLTNEFLADKPGFQQIEQEFIEFVKGAELIIHNADFDLGFLDKELERSHSSVDNMRSICKVLDTLLLARERHPGQRNTLDALCKRYRVDNSQRQLHGALLDAEILADVYLCMTRGQSSLGLKSADGADVPGRHGRRRPAGRKQVALPVIRATAEELAAHRNSLARLQDRSEQGCLWLQLEEADQPA